jgi:hypothetical protein
MKCRCPGCSSPIALNEQLFGKKLKCKCGQIFRAPQRPARQTTPQQTPINSNYQDSTLDPLSLPVDNFASPQTASPSKFQTRYNAPEKYKTAEPVPQPKKRGPAMVKSKENSNGESNFFDGSVISGMAMMIGAVAWFGLGLMAGLRSDWALFSKA